MISQQVTFIGVGVGSSYSMQVLHQLHDNQRTRQIFMRFVHNADLWNRLAAVTVRDTALATVNVLGECSEKIVAAIPLKSFDNNPMLEKGIDRVVDDCDVPVENGLTKQHVFFKKVSKVYRVLQELVNGCDEAAHSDRNSADAATLISETNNLLLSVLKEVVQHRQQNVDNFTSALSLAPVDLPWTAAAASQGLIDSLMLQQTLTCDYRARMAADNMSRNVLYDQLVSLVDIILDGYKSHLESIRGTSRENILLKQYQVDRHKLIAPLAIAKEWEKAEKYLDFETLVIICESMNNQQRLDEYLERFSSEGFSEFVYTWCLQENKPSGKLIDRCRTVKKAKNTQKLTNFLADHPSLYWMQNIFERKFSNAADILRDLGQQCVPCVYNSASDYVL